MVRSSLAWEDVKGSDLIQVLVVRGEIIMKITIPQKERSLTKPLKSRTAYNNKTISSLVIQPRRKRMTGARWTTFAAASYQVNSTPNPKVWSDRLQQRQRPSYNKFELLQLLKVVSNDNRTNEKKSLFGSILQKKLLRSSPSIKLMQKLFLIFWEIKVEVKSKKKA